MYEIPIVRLEIVRDSGERMLQVSCPEDVVGVARSYIGNEDREHMIALLLDTKNKINGVHTVSIGTLNSSIIHPREVFKAAIMGNAAALILIHNHPSGDPNPSQEDLEVTRRIREAGELIGIPLLDHIILGDGSHVSLKERGEWE